MQDERPVAAEAGRDHLAALGMSADLARQRQQAQAPSRGPIAAAVQPLGRLERLASLAFAELDIGPEAAVAQSDLFARVGVLAERAGRIGCLLGLAIAVEGIGQLPRIAAFGIVGAADEGAVFAELEGQRARTAFRAQPGVGAVLARRKHSGAKHLVERLEHVGDAQLLDVVDRAGEIAPEVAQHLLPGELAVGDLVELLLQGGGEVVFDVALEEAFEEGR